MRKFLLVLVSSLFAGYGWGQDNERPLVVATASIFADMAEVIGGGEVDVRSIVPVGGDPHIYEPTPGDARLVADADLILRNGLTFEGWLDELIAHSGTKARVVTITEGVDAIRSEKYQNSTDPHAWMDAVFGQIYIRNIADALLGLDTLKREIFEFNHGLYQQQLEDLHHEMVEQIRSIPEDQRILITSHDAFRYYGRRYGIQVEAILGTSTDADAQTSDIIRLSNIIREKKIPAVFIESTVNPKLLEQLAKDNRARIGGQLYSDSIGDKDSPAPTYLDMLRYNTRTIVEALRQPPSEEIIQEPGNRNKVWLYGAIGALLIGGFWIVVRRLNR